LRKDIVNVVELQPDIFIKDVIKLATKIERQQKKRGFQVGITAKNASKSISTSSKTWNAPKRMKKWGLIRRVQVQTLQRVNKR
jgi:hypothetical protein